MSHPVPRSHVVYTIAIIGFIFTLHMVIPMYSHSSFLSLFADAKTLGLIYMTGSAMAILGFLVAPPIIRRLGNYVTILWLIIIQIALFSLLITSQSASIIFGAFALQMAITSMIGLSLDIFLEVYTDSHKVGAVRGLYSATLNASWVIAPLIGSLLINVENYRNTYIAALAMLLPFFYLVFRNFPRFKDPNYMHLSPWQLIKHVSRNRNWLNLFLANGILQIFYAWMVVYSPIYLHQTLGFSWESIGIIITVMLLPFALIQYPLGKLSDDRFGEKEIMAVGFGLMGVTTIALAFTTSTSVIVWALALFMTRVGAAAAEIMIETYFFKTVSTRDTSALGLFRISRPISFFFAPLVAGLGLILFTEQRYLFIVIGAMVFLAIIPSLLIKDTK